MTRNSLFLPLVLLASLCFGQAPQALRVGCSPDDEQIATAGAGDSVDVISALAGGKQTCYKVALHRGEQAITGYVLGEDLPAVAAFLSEQRRYKVEYAIAQQQLEAEKARQEALARDQARAQAAHPIAGKLNPDMPSDFAEFGGRDLNGKAVSLSSLGGKVILVTFWSPRSAASKGQLLALIPLYNQYKRAGLRAVGISIDPDTAHMTEALDDMTLLWPQIPDRSGLAKRYGANAATGTTLVLDASHRILAVGLSPAELEKKVRELLASQ
jgi:peroxiredoxin